MRTSRLTRLLTTCASLPLLVLASCALQPPQPAPLTGQPSWHALGGNFYQEHDLPLADTDLLQFDRAPEWFIGLPRQVSAAEYKSHLDQFHQIDEATKSQNPPYFLTSPPPFPNTIHDLPLTDHNVRLAFTAAPTSDPAHIRFALTLTSPGIPVSREVEHRRTNALPFLFAFFIDGKPLTLPSKGISIEGGVQYMIPLASPNHPRQWNLSVDANFLLALLPDRSPHTLTLLAAFSNSQHLGYSPGDTLLPLSFGPLDRDDATPLPLLLRSPPTTLHWTGSRWQLRM